MHLRRWQPPVSIRRTDLCAFEPRRAGRKTPNVCKFQSVERICVPSNPMAPPSSAPISKRCFNPSNGFVCLRTASTNSAQRTPTRFNPSNGFVCLRTLSCEPLLGPVDLFQSVERICVPSNDVSPRALVELERFQSVERICVPSNCRLARCRQRPPGFNPSNGFVCLRTTIHYAGTPEPGATFQSVERICVPSNRAGAIAHCDAMERAIFESLVLLYALGSHHG